MKLSVIIPVYNEKKTLPKLLKKIEGVKSINKEIIIVDDGSEDSTRDFLKKVKDKYKVIFHEKNKGKGTAIRTGLKHATGDIVIIQDADLEYDPNDYNKLIKPIIEGKANVVYGSRRLQKQKEEYANIGFYIGGITINLIANILYPNLHITDEATCYKVFKADVIKNLNLKCKRFEFCPEVTAKLAKRKIKIMEIPISYHPRSVEEGKKINWKDGIEAIWTLLKYKFID